MSKEKRKTITLRIIPSLDKKLDELVEKHVYPGVTNRSGVLEKLIDEAWRLYKETLQ